MSDPTVPTSLYVYRDTRGVVLYVGITSRGMNRSFEHAEAAPWWTYAATTSIQHYADRATALAAEAEAIRRFRPPFNKQHNLDWSELREAYSEWGANSGIYGQSVSDGLCMTFDISDMADDDLWRLTRVAERAPNRVLIDGCPAREIELWDEFVTFYPKEPQRPGQYQLLRPYDLGRTTSQWTVKGVLF